MRVAHRDGILARDPGGAGAPAVNMTSVPMVRTAWLMVVLACALASAAAQSPAVSFAPLARSALVTLAVAREPAGVALRLERAGGGTLVAVTELTVAIDGKPATVTAREDGSWLAAWPSAETAAAPRVEVTVGHDGIHEVLSGTLAAPAGASAAHTAPSPAAGATLREHQQLAWWILNIVVVLIAVTALSRRRKT